MDAVAPMPAPSTHTRERAYLADSGRRDRENNDGLQIAEPHGSERTERSLRDDITIQAYQADLGVFDHPAFGVDLLPFDQEGLESCSEQASHLWRAKRQRRGFSACERGTSLSVDGQTDFGGTFGEVASATITKPEVQTRSFWP